MKSDNPIEVALRIAVTVVALAIWGVIGFVFWVPLLARATASFSSLILYTTLVGSNSSGTADTLDAATNFYIRGFENIFKAYEDRNPSNPEADVFAFGRFVVEVLWAVFFWGSFLSTLYTVGYASWLPDLWEWQVASGSYSPDLGRLAAAGVALVFAMRTSTARCLNAMVTPNKPFHLSPSLAPSGRSVRRR
jgi:hypothetical protein